MFLPQIAIVTPLRLDPEQGVLRTWPLDVRIKLISETVSTLLRSSSTSTLCESEFSIRWALELTGAAYSLPIEQHEVISMAIDLYSAWFRLVNVPRLFSARRLEYVRQMISHMTLLFEPRPGLNEPMEKIHCALLVKVINLLSDIVSEEMASPTSDTTIEHWEHVMNLCLGVVDSTISSRSEKSYLIALAPQLLSMLFRSWINSRIKSVEMWGRFQTLFYRWRIIPETINQWSATIFGFSNRVINLLFGSLEGTPEVHIVVSGSLEVEPLTFSDLTDQDVVFFWHRFLRLVGNPNEISSPTIFLSFMRSVASLVDSFLAVSRSGDLPPKSKSTRLPDKPTTESLLHIFGKWLFGAIESERQGFSQGTKMAFSTLCLLFSSETTAPITDTYMSRFYQYVVNSLEGPSRNDSNVWVIIEASTNLFNVPMLRGIHVLIPFFLRWIKEILISDFNPQSPDVSITRLRASCIKILNSILAIPTVFGNTNIVYPSYSISKPSYKTYGDLLPDITTCIVKGFENEKDSSNAILLLHTLSAALFEYINHRGFCYSVIFKLQRLLCEPTEVQSEWGYEVSDTCNAMLRGFSTIVGHIHSDSTEILPNLVSSIARYVSNQVTAINPSDPNAQKRHMQLIDAIGTIQELVIAGQWIYDSESAVASIFEMVRVIISFKSEQEAASGGGRSKGSGSVTSKSVDRKTVRRDVSGATSQFDFATSVATAATDLYYSIMHNLGNFPMSTGPDVATSLFSEEDLIKESGETISTFPSRARLFGIQNKVIITFFETDKLDSKEVVIISRSRYGKRSFRFSFRPIPLSDSYPDPSELETYYWVGIPMPPVYMQFIPPDPAVQHEEDVVFDNGRLRNDYFSGISDRQWDSLAYSLMAQFRIEEVYRYGEEESRRDGGMPLATPLESIDIERAPTDVTSIKLLLSHLGLGKISGHDRIQPLELTQSSIERLWMLDTMSNRAEIAASVFYFAEGENRLTDLSGPAFMVREGSEMYESFLLELGWEVDLPRHKGYTGSLFNVEGCDRSIYYADAMSEFMFHIASKMACPAGLKRIITSSDPVVIIWLEDNRSLSIDKLRGQGNRLFIIIRPRQNGSFFEVELVSFLRNPPGPLNSKMTLSRKSLSMAVRATVENVAKVSLGKAAIWSSKIKDRAVQIKEIISSLDRQLNLGDKMAKISSKT